MDWPLFSRLPRSGENASDVVLDRFLEYAAEKNLELYPAQEEAILELYAGKNVILNTPTGSGKSLVATALHFESLANGRRSIYTCPIKALVNEKFIALCREFGPDQVGMVTGDGSVNAGAPILCCTAEILSNLALREGAGAPVHDVIMDEFHYYSDRDRGVAWQIPLLTLPKARFLLMSATLGETVFFETELTRLTGRETVAILSAHRPVPLNYDYRETPLHETISQLVEGGQTPIYLVSFSQRECAEEAQNLLSVDFCTKDEKKAIAAALESEGAQFTSPYGKEIHRVLKHGIGLHHAGLLPKYRLLVEKLAQKGLLKVICGTDSLGVGVNVPIRTVLLTKLCKYDGEKTVLLSIRDFQQISGRAGRRGYDTLGTVVVQAPEHLIENIKMEKKAEGDPKKAKKIVKRKPPEKGYIPWSKETLTKLSTGRPEQLISRFQVTHAMLLSVLSRGKTAEQDGCRAMRDLIRSSHESDVQKKRHAKIAFQLFRSLVERKIIELSPLRVNVDLQEDFSLNHALSLYLVDTIKLLDPLHPEYAFDLLTLVESILENPELVLRKQLDRIKTEKMAEMKAEGIEFDQRIEELEKLEYPKPQREFIYGTFNDFAALHPWVGQENIRPKSVAREMFETFQTFSEYIRDYDLHRIEGVLLRYLSDVYKVLVQTVPDAAKTDEVISMTAYFESMLKQIDSSLLDEWERLRNPEAFKALQMKRGEAESAPEIQDITRDRKKFTILIRNAVFQVVRALALRDYAGVLEIVQATDDLANLEAFEKIWAPYYEDHARICTDANARNPKNTLVTEGEMWKIHQTICDPDGHNDWAVEFELDPQASRAANRPVLRLVKAGAI